MGLLQPEFEGEMTLDPLPEDFTARIRRRVESGLLVPGRRERADYEVTAGDRHSITFTARGFLTAYNIGLNEVTVSRGGTNQIRYQVSFWRWARAAVFHGWILGAVMTIGYFVFPALRRDVERYGREVYWGMIFLTCVLMPFLLSAFHKRFAERALVSILRETLGRTPADHEAPGAAGESRRAS